MFSTNEKEGELGFISKFLHKRGTILFPWLSTPTAIQQPLVILVGSIKVSLGGSYEWLAKSEEKSKSFYIFLSFFCNSWSFFLVKEDYHQFAFAAGPEMIKFLCNEMHL